MQKILIAEDNPVNMRLTLMALRSRGYNILEATDGEQALSLASKEQPDLVILDIQLPKVSGLEVVKRLKQMPETARIPVLAMTAYAMKGDRENILKAGCDAYVEKPINTRELPQVIEAILRG